jgi:uncharacterized phiE125 gp8 family phage protein
MAVIIADPIATGGTALAEAKAYLRVTGGGEDIVIERLLGTALELCEHFTGQVLLARTIVETLPAKAAWTRLGRRPVAAIIGVEAVTPEAAVALPSDAYATDIDAGGSGWVRARAPARRGPCGSATRPAWRRTGPGCPNP